MSNSSTETSAQPTHKYSLRQFVLYQAAMSGQAVATPEATVRDYARSHPDADLEEQLSFSEWLRRDSDARPV